MSFYRRFVSHNGLPITQEDKDWVENSFAWFAENFGLARVEEQPIYPDTEIIDDRLDYRRFANFKTLYEFICDTYKLDPTEIDVRWFDQQDSKKWVRLTADTIGSNFDGLFLDQYLNAGRENKFRIILAGGLDEDPFRLAVVIAHELAHVALKGKKFLTGGERDHEPLTDLFCIYFGFGALMANDKDGGYLPPEIIAYANALLVKISGKPYEDYISYFNARTSAEFKTFSDYFYYSDDCIFTDEFLDDIRTYNEVLEKVRLAIREKNGDALIKLGTSLVEEELHAGWAYGVVADGHLINRNFPAALASFEEGLAYFPGDESYIAGMGYCQMMMGDMNKGFQNLEMAITLNPFNSWVLLKMGEFLMKAEKPEYALEHFEKAFGYDRDLDEIHYWLGKAHLELGNIPLAKREFTRSKAREEKDEKDYPVLPE